MTPADPLTKALQKVLGRLRPRLGADLSDSQRSKVLDEHPLPGSLRDLAEAYGKPKSHSTLSRILHDEATASRETVELVAGVLERWEKECANCARLLRAALNK